MKSKLRPARLEQIYIAGLVIILAGIVVHAPLSVGLGSLLPDYELVIKSWKELIMILLVPIACIIAARRKLWRELLNDWVVRLACLYSVLHLGMAGILWQGTMPTLTGLAIDLRFVLFFVLMYTAVRFLPSTRRTFLIAAGVGAFVVVCFATLQVFLPPDILKYLGYNKTTIAPYLTVDENPDYIRINSTLRGPNPLGAYASIVLSLLAAAIAKAKLSWRNIHVRVAVVILGMCSLVALWMSYSRSALVAAVVAVLIATLTTFYRRPGRRTIVAGFVILAILAGGTAVYKDSAFISHIFFHENPNDIGNALNSNDDHFSSLQSGMMFFIQQPFGAGVGSTGSASLYGNQPFLVENHYLFIGHEVGWLGLAIFIALFSLVMIRLWRHRRDWLALGVFASGIGLSLIGLLLPVWADDTISIVWWGLAAIALGGGKDERTTE